MGNERVALTVAAGSATAGVASGASSGLGASGHLPDAVQRVVDEYTGHDRDHARP